MHTANVASLVRPFVGVRGVKMKGAYSVKPHLKVKKKGVRGQKMKGAYSDSSQKLSTAPGVRGQKMKGAYSDSWDIATKV